MSEKMEPIKSLAAEADNYSLEELVGKSYVYNAEKAVWEAKEVLDRVSKMMITYE